ncbi:hypothetical protein P9112_011314 [Eukaryota sp. TZLM1-RC]
MEDSQIPLDSVLDHIEEIPEPSSPPTQQSTSRKSSGIRWFLNQNQVDVSMEDEAPLLEELDIDLKSISNKLLYILLPFKHPQTDRQSLVTADFYGPLAVILLYGLLVFWHNWSFAALSWCFLIWLTGSFLVYFITKATGASVSYAGTLGLMGYSTLPLIVVYFLNLLLTPQFFSILLSIVGISWSSYSSANLLIANAPESKKWLIVYPAAIVFTFLQSLRLGV